MLPGVGIFGSEPVAKILVDILKHFEFEIHGIWTNDFETASGLYIIGEKDGNQLITTKIDDVLLNKNINLVFVCCQPNYHSQIASKALGI
jgi:predicted dehydrogenase